ncbi:MAG: regulatory protein GemA [Thermodesulfobacteriota bacterium]
MKQSTDRIKIHIARKELLLDDQTYRDILALNFPGAKSSKDLNDAQVRQLIRIFQQRGWQQKRPMLVKSGRGRKSVNNNYRTIPNGPYAAMQRKVLALWNQLGYEVKKLDARVKKQWGIDRIEWLRDYDRLHTLITDLEARVKREMGG